MHERSLPNNTSVDDNHVNYVKYGEGRPVVLIHGLAASYHDWDDLFPVLAGYGSATYALDLLGHGESGKPASRFYKMNWLFDHLAGWIDSLNLSEPPVLVGHSLGGYLALEYARRYPGRVRGLILVNPFFRVSQLPALLRTVYRRPAISGAVMQHAPGWLFRMIVDATSLSMGHSSGGSHNLPASVRAQTALDFTRTAGGVYALPHTLPDLTPHLSAIRQPSMVVWGERDTTLSPRSFEELVQKLPNVLASEHLPSGHVPHQSHAAEFGAMVLRFLTRLETDLNTSPGDEARQSRSRTKL